VDKVEVNTCLGLSNAPTKCFNLETLCITGDFSSCAFSITGKENRGVTFQGPFLLYPVRLKNELK
jgi:hypothetical protein